MKSIARLSVVIAALFALTTNGAFAAETTAAVAANFTDAAKEIAAAYKAKSGNDAVLSFGALDCAPCGGQGQAAVLTVCRAC